MCACLCEGQPLTVPRYTLILTLCPASHPTPHPPALVPWQVGHGSVKRLLDLTMTGQAGRSMVGEEEAGGRREHGAPAPAAPVPPGGPPAPPSGPPSCSPSCVSSALALASTDSEGAWGSGGDGRAAAGSGVGVGALGAAGGSRELALCCLRRWVRDIACVPGWATRSGCVPGWVGD